MLARLRHTNPRRLWGGRRGRCVRRQLAKGAHAAPSAHCAARTLVIVIALRHKVTRAERWRGTLVVLRAVVVCRAMGVREWVGTGGLGVGFCSLNSNCLARFQLRGPHNSNKRTLVIILIVVYKGRGV